MSTINPNSINGSIIVEDGLREVEVQNDKEPILQSFIEIDILKELQRELHLLDVENEFNVKVMYNIFINYLLIYK